MTRYVRADIDDFYVADGEGIVLVNAQAVRLSVLGTLVMQVCAEPKTREEITAALVEAFGVPEGVDSREATSVMVDQLLGAGLVRSLGESDS